MKNPQPNQQMAASCSTPNWCCAARP